MNQNMLPTSRRKLRPRWQIPWATKTGGLAFAVAGKSRLTCPTRQRAKFGAGKRCEDASHSKALRAKSPGRLILLSRLLWECMRFLTQLDLMRISIKIDR